MNFKAFLLVLSLLAINVADAKFISIMNPISKLSKNIKSKYYKSSKIGGGDGCCNKPSYSMLNYLQKRAQSSIHSQSLKFKNFLSSSINSWKNVKSPYSSLSTSNGHYSSPSSYSTFSSTVNSINNKVSSSINSHANTIYPRYRYASANNLNPQSFMY